jgi:hypothetical protein
MNIYKVTRISHWSFDTYSDFVCFAHNIDEAKNINPCNVDIYHEYFKEQRCRDRIFIDWNNTSKEWVKCKEDLIVTKLGTSESTQIGLILSSYHAG